MMILTRLTLAVVAVSLWSCSYLTQFVFENSTDSPAQISYVYRNPEFDWETPALGDQPKGPYTDLSPSDYTLSSDRTRITVVVPPGKCLRLFSLSNYPATPCAALNAFRLRKSRSRWKVRP